MTTVQLVSLADGKCLTHRDGKSANDTYGWDTFRMQDCVDGDPRQMIAFGTDNLIKYRDRCFLVANADDTCGSGRPDDFQVLGCDDLSNCRKKNTFTFDGLGKGPVRIRNNQNHTDRGYVNRDGILRHLPIDTNSSTSAWITLTEKKECDKYKIPLNECTVEKRNKQFCKISSNMNTERCNEYCKDKDCDDAMSEYCGLNPDDMDFCGCFNVPEEHKRLKLDSKPECYHEPCASGRNYRLMAQREKKPCPNINICDTKDTRDSQIGSAINSMNTTCNFPGSESGSGDSGNPKATDPPATRPQPSGTSRTWIWIVVAIVIVLFMSLSSGAALFLLMGKK